LAWWRERLEELDAGNAPPAEPRLHAVAYELSPRGVTGNELSGLEDAWLPLLQPFPWAEAQTEGLKLRGRVLFDIGARLLGGDPSEAEAPGQLWSLIDGALHCSDTDSRKILLNHAFKIDLSRRVPRRLRPITILAALAVPNVRDPSSGVARGLAATHHRLTGRIPRL
jgi:phytoene synthase